jgi:hypothetical protein
MPSTPMSTGSPPAEGEAEGDLDGTGDPDGIVDELPVAAAELARARSTFVAPPTFPVAIVKLRSHPVLVLIGSPGSGATEFAYQLLTAPVAVQIGAPPLRRRPGGRPAEVIRLDAAWRTPRVRQLAFLATQSHRNFLLDLRCDDLDPGFGGDLDRLGEMLRPKGSRLIVLARPDQFDDFLDTTREYAVEVRPPDVTAVIEKHLAVEGYPGVIERLRAEKPLSDLVRRLQSEGCAPSRVVRLAYLLMARPAASAPEICAEFLGWQDYLDRHFAGPTEVPYPRALLVSAAVIGTASVEAVVVAADDLMAPRGRPRRTDGEAGEFLAREEISDVLDRIEAVREGDIVRLTKTRPGVDLAILSRLWVERPAVREPLVAWLARISAAGHPASRYVGSIAGMIVYLADTHRAHRLAEVVIGWLDDPATRDLAIAVLDQLAVTDSVGITVRRGLGCAQADRAADAQRLAAIAGILGGEFGRRYVRLALRRLRDLLAEPNPRPVVTAARTALRQLARTDELRPEVLDQIAEWIAENRHHAAGASALLGLLAPVDEFDLLSHIYFANDATDWEMVKAGLAAVRDRGSATTELTELMTALRRRADTGAISPDAVAELSGRS